MFFFIEIRKHTGCILLENGAGIAASTPKRSFDMGRLIDRTVDELPDYELPHNLGWAWMASKEYKTGTLNIPTATNGNTSSWDDYNKLGHRAIRSGGKGVNRCNMHKSITAYCWRRQQ